MMDTRVNPLVQKAHQLVDAMNKNNAHIIRVSNDRRKKERIWITSICLSINIIIIVISFFI